MNEISFDLFLDHFSITQNKVFVDYSKKNIFYEATKFHDKKTRRNLKITVILLAGEVIYMKEVNRFDF